MPPTLADLLAERNALRVMLGESGKPVYLDVKPPSLLTVQERERFTRRLGEVNERIGCLPRRIERFGRWAW